MGMVKEILGEGRANTKFITLLHEVANLFVHHVAGEANKLTMSKNKSKILEEDIYVALSQVGFNEEDFSDFRAKLSVFTEQEAVY